MGGFAETDRYVWGVRLIQSLTFFPTSCAPREPPLPAVSICMLSISPEIPHCPVGDSAPPPLQPRLGGGRQILLSHVAFALGHWLSWPVTRCSLRPTWGHLPLIPLSLPWEDHAAFCPSSQKNKTHGHRPGPGSQRRAVHGDPPSPADAPTPKAG